MDSDFKSRLVEFARKQYDMGMTRFEEYTGINSGTINKIKDGVSTTTLAKIADACPELNLRWLLLGEIGGQMILQEAKESSDPADMKIDVHHNTVNIGNVSEFRDLFRDVLTEIMKGK